MILRRVAVLKDNGEEEIGFALIFEPGEDKEDALQDFLKILPSSQNAQVSEVILEGNVPIGERLEQGAKVLSQTDGSIVICEDPRKKS